MDVYKARKLEHSLVGKDFIGYTIESFINNGKSAAVFKGRNKLGEEAAIKIFDNELIERFGHEIQEGRIEKEIGLKGHSVPNLIKMIDGGKTTIETETFYFIVMEFVNGENLKQFISHSDYDNLFVRKIVKAIFNVTEELLAMNIVHRDIKPENILLN